MSSAVPSATGRSSSRRTQGQDGTAHLFEKSSEPLSDARAVEEIQQFLTRTASGAAPPREETASQLKQMVKALEEDTFA